MTAKSQDLPEAHDQTQSFPIIDVELRCRHAAFGDEH